MSVINKMLNDLDDRKDTDQAQDDVAFMTPVAKPKRKWLVTLVLSIVFGLTAVWGTFYFYSDILGLAGIKVQKQSSFLTPEEMEARISAAEAAEKEQPNLAQNNNQQQSAAPQSAQSPELIILKPASEGEQSANRPSTLSVVAVDNPAQQTPSDESNSAVNTTEQQSNLLAQSGNNENAPEPNGDNVQPGERQAQSSVTPADQPGTIGTPTAAADKMQVSKVRLSPVKRAEKAYHQAKELSKGGLIVEAIDKYMDVLRYQPNHQQGRSELAALYYGRNLTLDALNILDQGLELDPANTSWSLLAAKIHYKRTNFAAAYAYLQLPVETYDDIEYVALRATSAYKLKEYESARQAYQKLTVADPGNGRWWLGLGTAHEALGQQVYAVKAYRKSLRLSNISSSSRQFVLSRLQRLAN